MSPSRTFLVSTKTSMGRCLLQSERNASLFVDVLRSCVAAKKFCVHDFVVMPDHIHILLTVGLDMTIERAVQLIKGGYSYRLKKETGYNGDVWQKGFSEVRVQGQRSRQRYREYIAQNPVKAGLMESPHEFPYCFTYLSLQKQQGLKPGTSPALAARLKPGLDTNHSLSNSQQTATFECQHKSQGVNPGLLAFDTDSNYGVTGFGAFFGVDRYPVMLFLSAENTTISYSRWSRPV